MATNEDVIEYLSQLSSIELVQVTRQIEARWGVSPVVTVVGSTERFTISNPPMPGEDLRTVVLTAGGANRIEVIRVVREVTGLGLKDAKDLVDGAPKPVKADMTRIEADSLADRLRAAGATVDVTVG